MKYSINLDVYSDDFEPICFEGLTDTISIYNACKKAVDYCQANLERSGVVDVFIEVDNKVTLIHAGTVRIGVARESAIYRMYTAVINVLREIL